MQFEKDYFNGRNYGSKEELVKRNVVEVFRWASEAAGLDLFAGAGKRAFDVGCAYGFASEILNNLGYETTSVDVSKWGIHQAKSRHAGDFVVCDAQTMLPFIEGSFDLVTCFDVLEHLPSPEKALENMLASCRGLLICTTPNRRVEKPVRQITRDYDETHVSVKYPSEWEAIVKGIGAFKTVKVETFYDITAKLANSRVLFKSFKMPVVGLTARILVTK